MVAVVIKFLVCKDLSSNVGGTLLMNILSAVVSGVWASHAFNQLVHDERSNFQSAKDFRVRQRSCPFQNFGVDEVRNPNFIDALGTRIFAGAGCM
jgi:hypothetical protein